MSVLDLLLAENALGGWSGHERNLPKEERLAPENVVELSVMKSAKFDRYSLTKTCVTGSGKKLGRRRLTAR
ncbi:hypothetical protein EIB18_02345 [Caulobacter vibrioides]|uniref:hypothetical protein n=1 Tax=Caulobacter vibrioides TaxID=155892 RepID=UPI000F5C65A5|nr:hypothetical protein [Caulobacter vibrioides]AZH11663.1 hypothetical protein EIB18_02345 [Caulobacter vibrioides]